MKAVIVVALVILSLGVLYFLGVENYIEDKVLRMALLATYLGLGFTLLLVVASFQAVSSSKRASEAQVIVNLSSDYRCPEMHKALGVLRRWKEANESDWLKWFSEAAARRDEDFKKLDQARQFCTQRFMQLEILLRHQIISKPIARSIFSKPQHAFLVEVLEPMEKACEPDQDSPASFDCLKKLY